MNKTLLRDIQHTILTKPERFDMGTWVDQESACGTACCIGGWALVHDGFKPVRMKFRDGEYKYTETVFRKGTKALKPEEIPIRAEKALRLTTQEAKSLFYDENWPEDLRTQFNLATTPMGRALVAAQRIERLLAEGV